MAQFAVNVVDALDRDNVTTAFEYDTDLSGLISLCDALLTLKNPIELDLSECGLSVNGVNPVAKAISAGAVLNSMTVDSTGVPKMTWGPRAEVEASGPPTYTLTTEIGRAHV